MVEEKDVNQTPSPEGVEAPSPEAQEPQTPETETPTPQEGVTQEPSKQQVGFGDPTHPDHDRFVELKQKEKDAEAKADWYRTQLEQERQRQQPQQPQQPQDRYAGKTPEEKAFYEDRDKRMREIAAEEGRKYIPILADVRGENFLLKHPDIKPGTPEFEEATKLIAQGYPGDHAYQLATYNRKVGEKEANSQQTQQQRLEAKKKANVVSPGSVSSAATPPPKETWEQEFARRSKTELSSEET